MDRCIYVLFDVPVWRAVFWDYRERTKIMDGTIEISAFMDLLEKRDLVIAPRSLVEERLADLELLKLRKQLKRKPALSYKEIADARLWGKITNRAALKFAQKYAKPGEIFVTKLGHRPVQKITITAVERIAKQRGELWD